VIDILALILYVAAFLLWLRALLAGGQSRGALPAWIAAAGVVVHVFALATYTLQYGELPLVGLGPSLSVLALLTAAGLVGALAVQEGERIGIVLLPLAVLLQASAVVAGIRPSSAAADFRGGWWSVLHVSLGFGGIVGIALAAAAGWLYLVQFRELKAKRMGRLFHFLPPLATLDRLGRVGSRASFVFLTLSLGLGWAVTVRFLAAFGSQYQAQMWWGLFSWLAVLAAIIARGWGEGPAERRSAWANSLAFLLIAAGYLLLRLSARPGAGFL
jgi:HemX protein